MSTARVGDLRSLFANLHGNWLEGTVDGLDDTSCAYAPPGYVVPAGAHYLHHLIAEDAMINHVLRKSPPLFASDFAGKAGFDKEYPMEGPWDEWARTVTVDLDQARPYAQAVYANTDAYLAGLTDGDLDRVFDLSAIGFGELRLIDFLHTIALDGGAHCGEISAIKGLQEMKGYPF